MPNLSKYLQSASNHVCKLLILMCLAPRHGFEPRFTAPKAAVLPLDDRGICVGVNFTQSTMLSCYNPSGSHSWPVLGAGFKPVARYSVSRVGSTPTGFRHSPTALHQRVFSTLAPRP